MNTSTDISFAATGSAFERALTLDSVRAKAPAVFADGAHESMSAKYTFIPTARVLEGLMGAGFVPVEARQTRVRAASLLHARHIVRLRRRFETVALNDAVPEVVFLNSHDGTSSYQLRMGLFRAICTNGLIVSHGAFPGLYVSHRGNVVEEVIAAALALAERFETLAAEVARMEARLLTPAEEIEFAERALAVRYPDPANRGMPGARLLRCRRPEDAGEDLWHTLNRVQENLLQGGVQRRSASGRETHTRRISAIKQELRLNSALWDLATQALAA